jgi:hypothetical protein
MAKKLSDLDSYEHLRETVTNLIRSEGFDEHSQLLAFMNDFTDLNAVSDWIERKPQMLRLSLALMETTRYWTHEWAESDDMTENGMLRNLTFSFLVILKDFQEASREAFDKQQQTTKR